MFPYNEGLITALIKLREVEMRREFARYHLARQARAARPPAPRRLTAPLQRVRRWTSGAARMSSRGNVGRPDRRWTDPL